MERNREISNPIHIYEITCLLVIIASIVSMVLISIDHFHASYVLFCSSIALITIYLSYRRVDFPLKDRFGNILFLILVVAILLRWGPYPHHVGGQDQGLYINMSSVYEKFGSLNSIDLFRNTL